MPKNASYKSRGGKKDSAVKNTFNPPTGGGEKPDVDARRTEEQDAKRRIGQFRGKGEPPLLKK